MEASRKRDGVDAVRHRGPSLVALAVIHAALVMVGLVAPTMMAGGRHFPSPFDPEASRWFAEYPQAALTSAFFLFGSTVPLALFAASSTSRLSFLGMKVAGIHIALVGGVGASFALAMSAFAQWVLGQPGVSDTAEIVRALHCFAFASGGPGFAVPFGLLISGVALVAGLQQLLPRWLMWAGLVVAAAAELSALTFIWPFAAYLLPIARFLGMAWLIGAGAVLPKSRRSRAVS